MEFQEEFLSGKGGQALQGLQEGAGGVQGRGIGHSLDLMILEGFSNLRACEILGFSSSILQGVQGWGEANPE